MMLNRSSETTDFLPTRRSLLCRLKNADDQTGWQEFFDTYWKLIYGVARKAGLTNAEAQDAVQETVIAVSQHIGRFRYDPARCSFKTWLMLLTRQRIARQFLKRFKDPASGGLPFADGPNPLQRGLRPDDTSRTPTIERLPDPAGPALDQEWNAEWQKHLLATALNRVKRRAQPAHYEMYYLNVLKAQPARDVARTLGVSVAQVYLAKHRLGALLRKEVRRLRAEME